MKKITHSDHTNLLTTARRLIAANKLFLLSVLLLTVSLSMLVAALLVQRHTLAKSAPPPAVGYSIGTTVRSGVVTIAVKKVSSSNGEPGFSAPANLHYIVVDFSVKNNSHRSIQVLPTSDTYLKNTAGEVSYMTPFAVNKPFRAGELLAGESVTGQLSYIAPRTGGVKLYIDSIWSGGVVPFKVQ